MRISDWSSDVCSSDLLLVGALTFLIAIFVTIWRLWTIYMRFAYFIDPGGFARLKFLPVIRHLRAWRKPRNQPTYEYNPVPLGNDLRDEVTKIIAGDDPAEGSLDRKSTRLNSSH